MSQKDLSSSTIGEQKDETTGMEINIAFLIGKLSWMGFQPPTKKTLEETQAEKNG